MKTAEEQIKFDFDIEDIDSITLKGSTIATIMVDFAKEAIKADRENVAKHAQWKQETFDTSFGQDKSNYDFLEVGGDGDAYAGYIVSVDKNSIINAPELNLL